MDRNPNADLADSSRRPFLQAAMNAVRPDFGRLFHEALLRRSAMDKPQAMRDMTPDEIRIEELERLRSTTIASGTGRIFENINRRIEDLRPVEAALDLLDLGLRYRQDVGGQIRVYRGNPPAYVDGKQLVIKLSYVGKESLEYVVPPYQADQLRAIADGRPSWPDVKPPFETMELAALAEPLKSFGDDPLEQVIWHGIELLRLDDTQIGSRRLDEPTRGSLNRTIAWAITNYLQREFADKQEGRIE